MSVLLLRKFVLAKEAMRSCRGKHPVVNSTRDSDDIYIALYTYLYVRYVRVSTYDVYVSLRISSRNT